MKVLVLTIYKISTILACCEYKIRVCLQFLRRGDSSPSSLGRKQQKRGSFLFKVSAKKVRKKGTLSRYQGQTEAIYAFWSSGHLTRFLKGDLVVINNDLTASEGGGSYSQQKSNWIIIGLKENTGNIGHYAFNTSNKPTSYKPKKGHANVASDSCIVDENCFCSISFSF